MTKKIKPGRPGGAALRETTDVVAEAGSGDFQLSDHIEGVENMHPQAALNKLVRGMAALHRSIKERQKETEARILELTDKIENLARRGR